MSEVLFKNEYFLCEKLSYGSRKTTILKDEQCFYGISLEGSSFVVANNGFLDINFTQQALIDIEDYCSKNNIEEDVIKIDLAERTYNVLIGMLV